MQKKTVIDLIAEATALHKLEHSMTLKSTLLVGELEQMRASVMCGLSTADFAEKIGLSIDTYWKRVQAARMMRFFPETRVMVECGETSISVISMLATRLTPANAAIILPGIKHKSKRHVKELLSVVTDDGRILDREPTFEIRLTFTKTQMEQLERAKDILAAAGRNPGLDEVIVQAVADLIQRRDPREKAVRAARRLDKKLEKIDLAKVPDPDQATGEGHAAVCSRQADTDPDQADRRAVIPNTVRHQVWLRDQGQCTWMHPDGRRCEERRMLEIDHRTMVCRGGGNSSENLTLRCRFHNQVQAEMLLGRWYMDRKRTGLH